MRFLVMLSAALIRVSTLNASDVGQGIAADVKELLAFSHISEKPTFRPNGRGDTPTVPERNVTVPPDRCGSTRCLACPLGRQLLHCATVFNTLAVQKTTVAQTVEHGQTASRCSLDARNG